MDEDSQFVYKSLLPYLVFIGAALWVFALWSEPTAAFDDFVMRLCADAVGAVVAVVAAVQLRR